MVLVELLVVLVMVLDQMMMEVQGKLIPAIGAPDTPSHLLEFDPSYMVYHQGAHVVREPMIYDQGV